MYNLSKICKAANQLVKQGLSKSEAFKKAWALAKNFISKVAGTSFGKRNKAIEHLTRYSLDNISVTLKREHSPYDNNAVQVIAEVSGKGSYCCGYLPAIIASHIAPLMDTGTQVTATIDKIVGGWLEGMNYGLRLNLAI